WPTARPGGPCVPCPHRAMAPRLGRVRVSFPRHAPALLDSLNRLRLQGKFCDVAIHAGGRIFTAHSSVLAAASPFFHDKLLLRAGPRLMLPPAVDADAFEGLLELIYCGQLSVASEALPRHLLVASALQMWHVVERCSQILRELEGTGAGWGHDGSLASSPNVRGHDGSLASSRNIRRPLSSSLSLWSSQGTEGTIHGDNGTIHGDINTIHSRDGTIHGDRETIHGDSGTIHGDSETIHGDNDPSSSWATCTTTEELLQLHVATTRSPSPPSPSQEILQIRVKDDDDNDDTTRILPDVTTPPDPPTIVYIKPEPDTDVATPDVPAPSSWTPVDLHGNELPRRPGRPAHAPVKLGAAPADGKRFGCACGKRFAARPKRDRHILLTLSLRPFACARCHKRFKLKHHLGEHMKTHRG
ncbi:ZBTB9 protein, partial [Alaudala cheleensis]|nr:ZBTB9 protein [Alaudala cheleensis]